MFFTAAAATEVNDEEYLKFIEDIENCNATYGPGIATIVCIWRSNPRLTMGILTTIAANGPNNPGPPSDESEERWANIQCPPLPEPEGYYFPRFEDH